MNTTDISLADIHAEIVSVDEQRIRAQALHSHGELEARTCITFRHDAWKSSETPEEGQHVILREVAPYSNGWRALTALPHV